MKRLSVITTMILCLLIVAAMVAPAFSGATYIEIDNFRISKKSDGTIEIAGYKDTTVTNLVIPSAFYGNPVTSIAQRAFADNGTLTSITLPSSLTEINNGAFSGCTALESIDIPDGVTRIGSNAFYACTSLEEVDLGESVTAISGYAFNRCSSLKTVVIPDSVETIGSYAFYRCSSLESAVISSNVRLIDEYAFADCPSLKDVLIKSARLDLEIKDTAFDELFGLVITGVAGSVSEDYAERNGIGFKEYEVTYENGDVNKDMAVDGNDVTLCLKYIVGIISESDLYLEYADMNGDGLVNVKDATIIQKKAIGIL